MSIRSQQRDDMIGLLLWFVAGSTIGGFVGGLVVILGFWALR